MLSQCLLMSRLQFLRTVSRYESRDKYRDTSMNRADYNEDRLVSIPNNGHDRHVDDVGSMNSFHKEV